MRTLFVLNGCGCNQYTAAPLAGQPAAATVLERIGRAGVEALVLHGPQPPALPAGTACTELPNEDCHAAFGLLLERYPEHECFVFADLFAPFLQVGLGLRYAAILSERIAHYCYGEHYPRGIAPQALARETLQILHGVASGNNRPFDDEAVFDLMGIDINAYDIEIDVSPVDFRRYRLDLRARGHMASVLLERLLTALPGPAAEADYGTLTRLLLSRQELLRTLPAYVELDLSDNCNLVCDFCPRGPLGIAGRQDGAFAPLERINTLIGELADCNPEAVLALSPYSEPLLYPQWREAIGTALARGLTVVLETNGCFLDDAAIEFLASAPPERLIVIISVDFTDPAEYRNRKGDDRAAAVIGSTHRLLAARSRNTFVQVLDMDGPEEALDAFYETFKEYEDQVLPRAFSGYGGRIPGQASADIRPLVRYPCWHLKRDLVIRADGSVPLCRQDLDAAHPAGNVFTDGLATVWARLGEAFAKHASPAVVRERDGMPEHPEGNWHFPACGVCDDWHSFNF